jgi:hypothetical protein
MHDYCDAPVGLFASAAPVSDCPGSVQARSRASDTPRRTSWPTLHRLPLLMFGVLSFCFGVAAYLFGVLLVIPRYLLGLNDLLEPMSLWIVWYSGVPIVAGAALAAADLALLFERKRPAALVRYDRPQNRFITVALTAYNDELSISAAVEDFLAHPLVRRVIVVSNNSVDATFERAHAAGAITLNESAQGYGRCVWRCLTEAARYDDTELVALCEGDRTFRAADIEKLVAYIPHCDIVNGTRTVEPLRERNTQLTTFMYYGNVFVGKLLEAKHLGLGTITDVGTTYKLCRREALLRLLPRLNPSINLEFNAHLMDIGLSEGLTIVECPVTFHQRVGESKGGNKSNLRGLAVGLRDIMGIVTNWNYPA